MSKHFHPSLSPEGPEDARATLAGPREILIAHNPAAGPLTGVRNVLIQSSLSEIKECGYHERYLKQIEPATLAQLQALTLSPGWIPVELAHAHYEACDNMMLSREDFALLGQRVGERVQNTSLVTTKQPREWSVDPFSVEGALARMWPRLFQGGSIQVVKIGPAEKLIEERGFSLNRYNYYRHAHIAAVRATHTAIGAGQPRVRIESYSASRDELTVRVTFPT